MGLRVEPVLSMCTVLAQKKRQRLREISHIHDWNRNFRANLTKLYCLERLFPPNICGSLKAITLVLFLALYSSEQ